MAKDVMIPVAALAPYVPMSDQDRSYAEWTANASQVAADPRSASVKNLHRAINYLSHKHARLLARGGVSQDVLGGYIAEMDWYRRIIKEKEGR